ncbi:MAG: SDR family NAD(P)-dependent oxidoreductase [Gammaproteobacteria bacterium]
MRLSGKNIIITGSTSGIGKATALALADNGANIVISGRNSTNGELLAEKIKAKNRKAIFIKCDVTKKAEVEHLFKTAVQEFGHIDGLFNNAGIDGKIESFNESDEDNWDSVIDTNLKGTWYCMKIAIKHMIERGKGNILNMSSTSGLVGNGFGMSAYSASKFAVIGLTKSVALEYAKKGIRVNALCPAFVQTPMIDEICNKNPKLKRRFESCQPIGRMATVEEIANAVIYLLSDESSFITGTSFIIDGGLTI